MHILDTNTLIYFFKGIGNVAQRLLATAPEDIAIPSLVIYEIEYGIAKSTSPVKRLRQLQELCALITTLAFDQQAANIAGTLRARSEKAGTPIGPYDVLIAGITLAHQGTLVTNNTKEFSRIPELPTVDWF